MGTNRITAPQPGRSARGHHVYTVDAVRWMSGLLLPRWRLRRCPLNGLNSQQRALSDVIKASSETQKSDGSLGDAAPSLGDNGDILQVAPVFYGGLTDATIFVDPGTASI